MFLVNRPYLESTFFQMCMILTLVLVSFERKKVRLKNPENLNKISHLV